MDTSHYFYVLNCADNSLYAGYTINPKRRLAQHNQGTGAKYTRVASRRPVSLIFLTAYPDKSAAMQAEYAFKQLTRKQKEQYIHRHQANNLVKQNNETPDVT